MGGARGSLARFGLGSRLDVGGRSIPGEEEQRFHGGDCHRVLKGANQNAGLLSRTAGGLFRTFEGKPVGGLLIRGGKQCGGPGYLF